LFALSAMRSEADAAAAASASGSLDQLEEAHERGRAVRNRRSRCRRPARLCPLNRYSDANGQCRPDSCRCWECSARGPCVHRSSSGCRGCRIPARSPLREQLKPQV
jgi:hypothetical protein